MQKRAKSLAPSVGFYEPLKEEHGSSIPLYIQNKAEGLEMVESQTGLGWKGLSDSNPLPWAGTFSIRAKMQTMPGVKADTAAAISVTTMEVFQFI